MAASSLSRGVHYSRLGLRTISSSSCSRALHSCQDEMETWPSSPRPSTMSRLALQQPPPPPPSSPQARTFYITRSQSATTMMLPVRQEALSSPPLSEPCDSDDASEDSLHMLLSPEEYSPDEQPTESPADIPKDANGFLTRVKQSSPWVKNKEKKEIRRQRREGKRPSDAYADASGLWDARAQIQRSRAQPGLPRRMSWRKIYGKIKKQESAATTPGTTSSLDDDNDNVSIRSGPAALERRPSSRSSLALESVDGLEEDNYEWLNAETPAKSRRTAPSGHRTSSSGPRFRHPQWSQNDAAADATERLLPPAVQQQQQQQQQSNPAPAHPKRQEPYHNPVFDTPLDIAVGPEVVDVLSGPSASNWHEELEALCERNSPPPGIPPHAAQLIRSCKRNGRPYRIVARPVREPPPQKESGLAGRLQSQGQMFQKAFDGALRRTRALM